MKKMLVALLLFNSVSGWSAPIETHLQQVETFARGKRIAGGFMLTGLAAGFGVGAVLASQSDYPSTRTTGALVLGITAGIFAMGGIPSFFLPADFEKLPKEFREKKMSVQEGERILLQLRDQARTHRLIGSSIALTLGVAELGAFLATDRTPEHQWLVYSGATLTVLGSFVMFFFQSVPEKQWNAYHADKWRVSLAPLPGGSLASIRFDW